MTINICRESRPDNLRSAGRYEPFLTLAPLSRALGRTHMIHDTTTPTLPAN